MHFSVLRYLYLKCMEILAHADQNRLGFVNYEKMPSVTFLTSRENCFNFSLLNGHYLLVPAVTESDIDKLPFLLRVFSYTKINVEPLKSDMDNFLFQRQDSRYISVLILRCCVCDKLIEGKYMTRNGFTYHNKCIDKTNSCDFCFEPIQNMSYTMPNGMSYCVPCHEIHTKRINSCQ